MKKIPCFAALLLAALCVLTWNSAALAELSEPRRALEARVDEILNILKSPEFQDKATHDAAIDKIDAVIRTIFDFEQFSARTVGPHWPQFTPEQKKNFQDAFAALLRATYLDKLDSYSGEKVVFTGENASSKGDKVEISSDVVLKDKTIPVSYRMINRDGRWAVYDMIIEGMSLVQNYRSQFQDILNTGTPEQLTQRVWDQAKKIRETPADANAKTTR